MCLRACKVTRTSINIFCGMRIKHRFSHVSFSCWDLCYKHIQKSCENRLWFFLQQLLRISVTFHNSLKEFLFFFIFVNLANIKHQIGYNLECRLNHDRKYGLTYAPLIYLLICWTPEANQTSNSISFGFFFLCVCLLFFFTICFSHFIASGFKYFGYIRKMSIQHLELQNVT